MSGRHLFGGGTLGSIKATRFLDQMTREFRQIDEAEAQRIRDERDDLFRRAVRKCETPGNQNPMHGWREEK